MADDKNLYHLMLGLPEDVTSPDHYQLLGLEQFEDDQVLIKEATLDANKKLLAWQNSKYHVDADHLMDQVVSARVVRLGTKRKAKHDEGLRQRLGIEEFPDASEEPDDEIALAPLPPSRAERRHRAAQQPENDESRLDFGKFFLWGLGGGAAVTVMVIVGLVLSRPSSSGSPMNAEEIAERVQPSATDSGGTAETPLPQDEKPTEEAVNWPLLVAPFDESDARQAQLTCAKLLETDVSLTNSIGMKLILMPPGEFLMGSPENESGHGSYELQHRVRITEPFFLQTTEVTQGQWEAIMGTKLWSGRSFTREGPNYAATYVSWNDAQLFCQRLSARDGGTYRLPTETEWEYACRAGTTTAYCFGDDASQTGQLCVVRGEHAQCWRELRT